MKLHSELYTMPGFVLVLMLAISLAIMIICYCTVHLKKIRKIGLTCNGKEHKTLSFYISKNYLLRGKIITELQK